MEWNETLQAIIDYVEDHLQRTQEKIDYDVIASIAGCSFPFFQKVFSYLNGMSFAEYIRSRKLTLAGYDLQSTDSKVIEISYKYGYDSPTSFTKAFQLFHGVTPSEARKSTVVLQVVPKMQIASRQAYAWSIEPKKGFRLVGKQIKVTCEQDRQFQTIPMFWNECQRNGIFAQLNSLDTAEPKGLFGVFGDYDKALNEVAYSIMTISDQALPQGFTEIHIPATSWAVFTCKGLVPQAIQKGWQYLNEEWLIRYPFRHAPCPELEWYSAGNMYDPNYFSQIWIPIIEEE